MNVTTYINHLNKDFCTCSLPDFYKKIAEHTGYTITESTRYDCRKICCTDAVRKAIFQYFLSEGFMAREIAFLWCSFGPKANLKSTPGYGEYRVSLEPGAIYEKGEKKHD